MVPGFADVLDAHAEAIEDADEETFELFSIYEGSNPLGMVAQGVPNIDVSIAGRDFNITQSPGLLASNRQEGTTGAVLWNVNPLFAEWLFEPTNFLWANGLLTADTTALELGAGISPLIGLSIAPRIRRYVITDQGYVLKLLRHNVEQNLPCITRTSPRKQRKPHGSSKVSYIDQDASNIRVVELDWEVSELASIMTLLDRAPDVLFAVDCVFNPAIIQPFVSTLTRLAGLTDDCRQVLVIIAQQLRSPDVFSEWLNAMLAQFKVWRVNEKALNLKSSEAKQKLEVKQGYVVHICVLRYQ